MKELSIEEKAKRYDEAVERAKYYQKENGSAVISAIFPELKESEDEKIRNALLEMVHDTTGDSLWVDYDVHKEDAIAWLEKQGEHANFRNKIQIGDKVTRNEDGVLVNLSQLKRIAKPVEEYNITGIRSKNAQGKLGEMIKKLKPVNEVLEQNSANKVEPKFKIEKDKWYICIRDLDDNYGTRAFSKGSIYHSTKDETLIPDNSNVPFEIKYCVNDYFRLWTIQDAKDGDVLACENDIVIFKENNYNPKDKSGCMFVHCSCNNFYEIGGINPTDYKPATKEQRELLFQKMKEAGYEWDAEKKELKKIVAPIFHIGDRVRYKGHACDGVITEITDTDYICGDAKLPISTQDKLELVEQKPAEEYNITGIGSKNAQGKLGEMIKNLKPVSKVLEHESAWSEKYIADVFEKVGLAKIAREQGYDALTEALQYAMIELSKFTPQPKQE